MRHELSRLRDVPLHEATMFTHRRWAVPSLASSKDVTNYRVTKAKESLLSVARSSGPRRRVGGPTRTLPSPSLSSVTHRRNRQEKHINWKWESERVGDDNLGNSPKSRGGAVRFSQLYDAPRASLFEPADAAAL
ncbi:hypothetical protein EVAR_79644_1 [Eumeta japonica]|uniref:Uncharacterized protein n=1 Tax=Eumeta variegata TaxID=151549 RepID=A0A4C1W8S9_EUMVA|nr:hypothetical protein EVAR_79644_1 [Eumeta japonica]